MRVGNIVNMGYGMYYKIIRVETLADGRKSFRLLVHTKKFMASN